ncbi:MAG: nucleotide exchange factor GrpE [Saprospiraceae bacterium]
MLTEENKDLLEELEENKTSSDTIDTSFENILETSSEESPDPLSVLSSELADQKDKLLRLYAEFENYKRRTSKERIDLIKTAGQDVIVEMISILDDFDRAQRIAKETNNSSNYTEGMSLLHQKLITLLSNRGLHTMNSTGQVFDPELHEAIAEIPAPSEDLKGKIVDTVEKGYLLSDKIIRFAKVVIGK